MSVYGFIVNDINGKECKFEEFQGKVFLIVNMVSVCGFIL